MITDTFTFKEDVSVFEGNPDYTQMTIDQLYQLRSMDNVTDGASNVKGWQKEINTMPEYYQLRAMIMEQFVGYFQNSVGKLNMEAAVVKFFANINPPGASHTMHHHVGGHYSGAYWLQAEQGAGNIVIMNPYPNNFINTFCQNTVEKTDNGFKTFDCIEVKPQANKGVFFNSNLVHYVDVNRSDKDRIGVAFHLYLKE